MWMLPEARESYLRDPMHGTFDPMTDFDYCINVHVLLESPLSENESQFVRCASSVPLSSISGWARGAGEAWARSYRQQRCEKERRAAESQLRGLRERRRKHRGWEVKVINGWEMKSRFMAWLPVFDSQRLLSLCLSVSLKFVILDIRRA